MAQNQSGFCDKGRFIIDRNKFGAGQGAIVRIEIDFSRALRRPDFDKPTSHAAGFRRPRIRRQN